MPDEDRLRLEAILERIALVRSWVVAKTEPAFVADLMARDAVALSLLVIGETARRLSEDVRARAPNVPWSETYLSGNVSRMGTKPWTIGWSGRSFARTSRAFHRRSSSC